MISEYIYHDEYLKLRKLLTPQNRLVMDLAIDTGIRVGDVVSLPASALEGNTLTYTAAKTGKIAKITIAKNIAQKLKKNSDGEFLFPSNRIGKHRTRQAVWQNVKAASEKLGFNFHISPHSARKAFAVDLFHDKGIKAVQRALQHENVGTTMLYAYSDITRGNGGTRNKDIIDRLDAIIVLLEKIALK